MKIRNLIGVGSLTLVILGSGIVTALAAAPEALRSCARQTDVLKRLSCYDTEMAKLEAQPAAVVPSSRPSAAPVSAPVAAPAPIAARTAPASASLGDEQVRRAQAADAQDTGLTARIDSLQTRPDGMAVITLDNGQVWRQQEAENYFPLATGETVRIEKGALGSYRMTRVVEGWNKWMRIRRVK